MTSRPHAGKLPICVSHRRCLTRRGRYLSQSTDVSRGEIPVSVDCCLTGRGRYLSQSTDVSRRQHLSQETRWDRVCLRSCAETRGTVSVSGTARRHGGQRLSQELRGDTERQRLSQTRGRHGAGPCCAPGAPIPGRLDGRLGELQALSSACRPAQSGALSALRRRLSECGRSAAMPQARRSQ